MEIWSSNFWNFLIKFCITCFPVFGCFFFISIFFKNSSIPLCMEIWSSNFWNCWIKFCITLFSCLNFSVCYLIFLFPVQIFLLLEIPVWLGLMRPPAARSFWHFWIAIIWIPEHNDPRWLSKSDEHKKISTQSEKFCNLRGIWEEISSVLKRNENVLRQKNCFVPNW